ncbi:MAG: diamine N-acetyltransferase [Verrucomicrobiota bacterium]|nr:diamine N-acetyltransferase [Verrucomicrobiota bacterium]
MPVIRKADLADAPQLALIAERTFRDTFAGQNTAENMDQHCRLSYGAALQAEEISAPHRVTLLAKEAGVIVGFAQLRWKGAPRCVEARSPAEIQRLYVVKDWHGRGVAQELMSACIEEIRNRGGDAVWLGVWERNPRAISFYRKFGFVEVGEHVFPLGTDPQRDIVMVRPVGAAG